MEAKDIVLESLDRIHALLQRTLKDLAPEDLHRLPSPDSNSIAWLAWHLTRVQDVSLSGIMDQEQLWTSQGWHTKFGIDANAGQDGFGDTPEQVAAFRAPSAQTLLDYHESVLARSKSHISGLTSEGFDRELNERQYNPPPTVGVRLISVISDNIQHAGQAGYLRGLLQGRGWQAF